MSFTDDIARLADLHQRGALTDDEFATAKARLLSQTSVPPAANPVSTAVNALRRSRADRWIGGVCGGLAELSGIAAWAWRLAFVLLAFCGGAGVVLYLLMWLLVPDEPVPPLVRQGGVV